ncbi:MAG: hypothetical protein DRO88_13760 [Promethearchaeia archaeon]|nr:MAG: hypothetical protein DRO88_13760 [Candidatus Lokiarchaeia archaeon]
MSLKTQKQKNENIKKAIDVKAEKRNIEATLDILNYMGKEVRLMIIIHLSYYGKLSLNQLSESLGVAKGTITNHITPLVGKKIILITEKKIRGPIKKKFYELSAEFHSLTMSWRLPGELKTIPEKELEYFLMKYLEIDRKFIKLMMMIFSHTNPKFQKFEKTLRDMIKFGISDHNSMVDVFYKHKLHHYFYLLNENEAKIYEKYAKKFQKEFESELLKFRKKNAYDKSTELKQKSPKSNKKTHISWNLIIPIIDLFKLE